MLDHLEIVRTEQSRLPGIDFASLKFGTVFADHMLTLDYADGSWSNPMIRPYGPLAIEPGTMTLHYGQAIFEGMKAYRDANGGVRLFRPEMNAKRMQSSAEFLALQPLPDGVFEAAVEAYLRVDADWVPRLPEHALYLRPMMFSSEPHLEVRPSTRYMFVVIGSPVGSYFESGSSGLNLLVEEEMCRVPPSSGMGAAKAASNYSLSLRASRLALEQGYDQVLWLDGVERRYIEEAGLMNFFAVIDGVVRTPPLNGDILPGVTRNSILRLLADRDEKAVEGPIAVDEVIDAAAAGTLSEMFAAGTAAVITPIASITYQGRRTEPTTAGMGPMAQQLYDTLTGIQYGRTEDPYGWSRLVVPAGVAEAAE